MNAAAESPADSKPIRNDLRSDLIKLVALAVPTFAVNAIVEKIGAGLTDGGSWLVGVIALPVLVVVWLVWQVLSGRSQFAVNTRVLAFVCVYALLFSLISHSSVFLRRRGVINYGDRLPETPTLGWMPSLDQWRYAIVPRPEADDSMLLLKLDEAGGKNLDLVRYEVADLLENASANNAKGVALDFFFEQTSPASDPIICSVAGAWPAVYAGERHVTDTMIPVSLAKMSLILGKCLGDHLGHLSVIRDPDGVVRSVPMQLPGLHTAEALSFKFATSIAGKAIAAPPNQLVEFLAPRTDSRIFTLDELKTQWNVVNGRWLFVGSTDHFQTPFGDLLGVQVHKDVVQGLLSGSYIRRPGWLWTLPTILVSCYITMAMAVRRERFRDAVILTAICIATIILSAVAAMGLWAVWLEIENPVVALSLFLLLLWVFSRIPSGARSSTGPT
jgi:CHASE2 domain-containing sensor protein